MYQELQYNRRHGVIAVRQITQELRRLADFCSPLEKDRTEPLIWKDVADYLKVGVEAKRRLPGNSSGRLIFLESTGEWVIQHRRGLAGIYLARVLVHELAHWFMHNSETEWLCFERGTVYYYEGNPKTEQHELARWSENLVVQSPYRKSTQELAR